jgi:5-methyltetrahydropteroyltriglutamate--homocysteine methyltransferase
MTTASQRKIYRADHSGSFIRPDKLRQARADHANGKLSDEALAAIEDEAIENVLALQKQVGLDVYSDGEFRRKFFFSELDESLEGVIDEGPEYDLFPDLRKKIEEIPEERRAQFLHPNTVVVDKLKLKRRIAGHESAYLKQHAPGPFKITIPSPIRLSETWFKPGVTDKVYPNFEAVLQDVVKILASEAKALADEGVPYIQLDAPGYTRFMVPERRARMADPEKQFAATMEMENEILRAAHGDGVTVGVHICLGTYILGPSGPYGIEPVEYDPYWTGRLLETLDADVFQVEYTGRGGALESLKNVPHDKTVVLGIVNVRDPRVETEDELLRKIEDASKYFPVESLALAPNCGFAGNNAGAFVTEDQQRQKLEVMVSAAHKVWG